MAYSRGTSSNIIVGAAALFVADTTLTPSTLENFSTEVSFRETLSNDADYTNVGYTMNGLEMQFQPDFGEVQVDQILDVAKLYKQGMQVNMVTAFAEATLENLLVSIAGSNSDLSNGATQDVLVINSGELGAVPVERALIAVGPGSGDPDAVGATRVERVYVANRALSIDSVTVSAKRDTPSMFEVSFRLLPASNGSYGKIVDRVVGA